MAMLEVRDLRKSFYTYAKPGLQAGIFHKPGARKVVSPVSYTHLTLPTTERV